ncbi:MAG: tRNA (N(6)-L-threonylcarbamoyladenosine(37)-C(2))-methylthiotransferase MtaB [Bdellovibrionales bacterium]|nr:tRNA (N(6)-L-threonylcarbamoyladenosine(37)-C(2))-methylthiotransferase MtaB [Bdellovibrionales bacterium]
MKNTVQVQTFGCKVNTYDSGLLQDQFKQNGFGTEKNPTPSVFVLNSCAVTANATRDVLRQAQKLKKENPQTPVVITGCSAQVDTETFLPSPAVDLIVGNSHKSELPRLIEKLLQKEKIDRVYKSNIFANENLGVGGGEENLHTRSFLKIQDGCNSFCTFCVIPFARGKSRSLPPQTLINKIQELESKSIKEVVLTGVHIGDYEYENYHLADLVQLILDKTKIPRIRLSSLEPVELTPHLLELYSDPRLCPHFHMSIQSGSTTVLQRMKRQYSSTHVTSALELIHKKLPNSFVGIDVIAGFPEESEVEFEETFQCLNLTPWTRLHVFPYSPRPLTYAARNDNPCPPQIIKARAEKLRFLSAERHSQVALAQRGTIKKVLPLRYQNSSAPNPLLHIKGLSRDYWPVVIPLNSSPNPNKVTSLEEELLVKITGSDRHEQRTGDLKLYGEIVTFE